MQPPTVVAVFLFVLLKVYAQNTSQPEYPAHVGFEQNQYFKKLENRITENEEEIKFLENRVEKSESGLRDMQGRLNKLSLTSEISAISARLDTEIRVGLNYSAQFERLENRFKVMERMINSLIAKVEDKLDTEIKVGQKHLAQLRKVEERVRDIESGINSITSTILVTDKRLDKLDTEIQAGQKHSTQLRRLEERIKFLESGMSSINEKLDTDTFTRNLFETISNVTGRINTIENRIAPIIPKTPPVVAYKSYLSTNSSYPSPGIWLLDGASNDWTRISGSPCTHGALNIANSESAVIRWISSVPETCHLLVSFEMSSYSYEYTILDSDANCVDSHLTILRLQLKEANSSGKLCSHGLSVTHDAPSSLLVFHSNSTKATVNIKLKIQVVGRILSPNTEMKSFAHILPSDKWGLTVEQTDGITWVKSIGWAYVTALITQSDITELDGGTELIWEITKLNLTCGAPEFLICYDIGRMENVGLVPNIWGETICGSSSSIPADYGTQVGLVCLLRTWYKGSGYAGKITRVPRLTPSV